MPYPHIHIIFFLSIFAGVLIYIAIQANLRKELCKKDNLNLLFIIAISSFCALLPDIPFIYNFILYESSAHLTLGPVYTHSIFFGLSALAFAYIAGYIYYKNSKKIASLAILGLAAFLSHLLADDMSYGHVQYLYPIYNKPISLFSNANVSIARTDLAIYNLSWLIIVLFFLTIMLLSLFALNNLGFEFKYRSK